jgi:hypothetical protein
MSDAIITAAVNVVTMLLGYEAVRRSVLSAMHNKVDVQTYSLKVKELHDEINTLRTEVAVLRDRQGRDVQR